MCSIQFFERFRNEWEHVVFCLIQPERAKLAKVVMNSHSSMGMKRCYFQERPAHNSLKFRNHMLPVLREHPLFLATHQINVELVDSGSFEFLQLDDVIID